MSKTITIIGAGMAGLLAGNMLRRHPVEVVESQPALPNNHHAVLRFRTTRVSEQTHIPFREVRVFKGCDEPDPIRAAMLYAHKVVGHYELRSLIDLSPSTRYVAPSDFIEQMGRGLPIKYGVDGLQYLKPEFRDQIGPVISTLPMPTLMDALEYDGPRPAFRSAVGMTISAELSDCDVFATRYYASQDAPYYRASITGNRLVIEFARDGIGLVWGRDEKDVLRDVMDDFGFIGIAKEPEQNHSKYAKLAALSADDRRKAKDFMFWASNRMGVFSLGRFATWRSGLLLDDVVNDVIKIERWISSGSVYDIQNSL